jgi:uncharacterized protein YukJ
MNNYLYCVFESDGEEAVLGIFDNIKSAEECYEYYVDFLPKTHLIHLNTKNIKSKFIEPELEDC